MIVKQYILTQLANIAVDIDVNLSSHMAYHSSGTGV